MRAHTSGLGPLRAKAVADHIRSELVADPGDYRIAIPVTGGVHVHSERSERDSELYAHSGGSLVVHVEQPENAVTKAAHTASWKLLKVFLQLPAERLRTEELQRWRNTASVASVQVRVTHLR